MKLLTASAALLLLIFVPRLHAGTNTNVTACTDASLVIDITQLPICPGVEEGEVFAEVVTAGNVSEFVLLWDAAIDATQIPAGQPSWDQRIIRVAEGNYVVTASNVVDGCTFATNFTVTARNPAITFDIVPEFDCVVSGQTTCVELENLIGGIDQMLAGTAYLLDWNVNGTFVSGDRVCGLGPGNYSVTVSALEPANGNVSTVCTETRQFSINQCLSAAPVMDCVDLILDCVGPIPLPAVTDDNDPAPRVEVLNVTERFEPDFCRVLEVDYRAVDFDGGQSFCTRVLRYLDQIAPARVRFEEEFPDQLAACPSAITTNLPLFRLDLSDNCGLRLERPPIFDCPLDAPLDGTAPWTRGVFNNQTGGAITAPSRFWACQNVETNTGSFALQAGGFTTTPLLGDSETTFLETQVTGPGSICFAFRVSSERQLLSTSTADFFRFFVGTNLVENVAGEAAWNQVCHNVPAGPVTLRWEYAKDDFLSVGDDGAWLDDIYFQTPNPPPFVQVDRNIVSGSGCGTDRQEIDLVYTAEDTCGNQASFTQRWSIADSEAPVAADFATVFPDQFVGSLSALTTDLVAFEAMLSDNCGVVTTDVIQAAPPVGCSNEVAKLVYRAFDACGQEGRYTQTWAIARSLPTFDNMPGDVVIDCNDSFPDPLPVTGVDSDGNALTATSSLRPFRTNCSGRVEFERVYRLAGSCGLESTYAQRITFTPDTDPPQIGLSGLPPPLDGGSTCEVEMPDIGAFSVDLCGAGRTNVVQTPAPGTLLAGAQLLPVVLFASDGCGNSVTVTVAVEIVCDEPANGSISGVVWQDLAGDGSPAGDNLSALGVAGVTVALYRIISGGTSNLVSSVTTATGGGYAFGNVTPGDYVVVPSGIPQGAGTLGVSSLSFTVMGQSETANFPLIPAAGPQNRTLAAIVWNDLSVDGDVQNENLASTGLSGVRITATDRSGANPPVQFVTGSDGIATMSLQIGSSYDVTFEPTDIPSFLNRRSTPTNQTITVGLATPDLLFGVHRTADAVTLSSVDLEFVPPALTWTTSFEEDTLGFYVYQEQGGGNWVLVNTNLLLAVGGGDYSVPLPDDLGPYSLREVTTDMNEVELALVDRVGDVVNVELRLENLAVPRAPSTGSVSGTVWEDLNNNGTLDENPATFGRQGVEVTLTELTTNGTPLVLTTVSTFDGSYSFPGVPAGSYRVSVDRVALEAAILPLVGLQFTTPTEMDFSLSAGEDAGPFDFGTLLFEPGLQTKITVWNDRSADGSAADEDLAQTGLSGIRVVVTPLPTFFNQNNLPNLDPFDLFTDTNGCAVVVLRGDYEISLDESTVPAGFDLRSTPVVQSAGGNVDFGVYAANPASVTGVVWDDLNINGVDDEDLAVFGITNFPVTLSTLDSNGTPTVFATTTTTTNGLYSFDDLPAGSYRVSVEVADLLALPGVPGPTTPVFYDINLSPGDVRMDNDFGSAPSIAPPLVQVKITVWADFSNDGSVTNENLATTGLEGVRVRFRSLIPQNTVFLPLSGEFVTGSNGCVLVTLEAIGSYELELVESSVPDSFDLRTTPTKITIGPQQGGSVFFGVNSTADAVGLESVDIEADLVRWTTAWEQDVLGYRLYRRSLDQSDDTAWTLVNPALVLAVGGGAYELRSPNQGPAPTVFSLRELTSDLNETEIARFADAAPRGEPVALVSMADGQDTVVVPDGTRSVLVEPAVRLEDAAEPGLELLGVVLETSSGTGIYFSWPEGRRVRVR